MTEPCQHEPAVVPICWASLVIAKDGRAFVRGVEIKNPCECLRCGHIVTIGALYRGAIAEVSNA